MNSIVIPTGVHFSFSGLFSSQRHDLMRVRHMTGLLMGRAYILLMSGFSEYHQNEAELDEEKMAVLNAQKDPRHFSVLYERYYKSIFIFVNKRVDDEALTAELTSDVFFKALKNIKKFEFRGVPFSAWLFRIAVNEVNQFFRKEKKRIRAVSLTGTHAEALFEEIDHRAQDREQLLSRLLSKLNEEDLQLLELRFFEERPYKEIAYLLDISEGNAKVKTYRVIKKLRDLVQGIS